MKLELPKYNLDFKRVVNGLNNFTSFYNPNLPCHIDRTIVEKKFALWNYVAKEDLLNNKDPYIRAKALMLLKDKTIFAYANLKLDASPLKMRWMQDCILSDPGDRILFCACNQFLGKSTTLDTDAATEFMFNHEKGWIGILVSNSLIQSKQRMNNIKMLLKTAKLDYREEETIDTKTGRRDNQTQISFTFYDTDGTTPLYSNLLICCPHTSSALGYPADNLWLDEFDFWDDCDYKHFIYQIAIPRTFETKGKIKVYTNPDGKSKMLYTLWNQKDKNGVPVWHRYQFNYWDRDNSSQEGFDKAKESMTRLQVESTLLATFADSSGSYFSDDEIRRSLDKNVTIKTNTQIFMFLDVGAKHDQSVLTIGYIDYPDGENELPHLYVPVIHCYPAGYPLSRVVGAHSLEQDSDGWHYEKSLKDYYNEFIAEGTPVEFGVDVTGNSGIIPLCNTAGLYPSEVTFSGPEKSGMYQRFKYIMEKGLLHRCDSPEFDFQCSHLVMTKSTRGYLMIHHENEDELDDVPDSVAGLISLSNPGYSTKFAAPGLIIVQDEVRPNEK